MNSQQARYKKIKALMCQTHKIRNVSIVAHVDHGKTTLADCLLASNGVIHKKQAGQLRILDDRLDEQDRGITMKSSSISLLFQDHLINLIDSPGHLEFYSEVSSALRLTDSALLVVDTVEGVSSQTFRVLQQLYTEKLPAVLVLNKIDKLIVHCKMEPFEAYHHLSQIIEQVNAILGSFIMMEVSQKGPQRSQSEDQKIDKLESLFYFSPQKKNIVFGSSLDNWGFSVETFSHLIAKKLGKQPSQIHKFLWGDYYFHPKTKQFLEDPRKEGDLPVCVEWILKPIWDVFENVESQNKEKIQKMITSLQLKISENTKKNYNFQLVKEILNAWLPLDRVIMQKVIQILPNPIEAQKFRLPYLLNLNIKEEQISEEIINALQLCSSKEDMPLIAFVAKMVNIPKKQINERGLKELHCEDDNATLGYARIFSGRITRGQSIILIGAKKKKIENQKGEIIQISDITKTTVDNLYYFNAQFPQGIEEAYAGNIVGIGNLQNYIFKSGTISTSENCISFIPISSQTKSILKVSISTPNIEDNNKLIQGLRRLNKSDPSVDVYVQNTGDIILNTCGQVHLEKCVVDLEKIYCKVPIKTSQPIISFRETIIWQNINEIKNEKYLLELQKKKKDAQKKLMKQKYKIEMKEDAELDEQEKQKIKAIKQWDSHVEIYESEDLTVEDTRYFLKNRNDLEKQRQIYSYKQEKQLKKVDHKNRGKMHTKQKFMNLNLKTNLNQFSTPNLKIKIKIRAIGMPFEIAEYLDKNSEKMKKIFATKNYDNKEMEDYFQAQKQLFFKQLNQKFEEHSLDQTIRRLILQKMISFGPNPHSGSNFLICKKIPTHQSFFQKSLKYFKIEQNEALFDLDQELLTVLKQYNTTPTQLFKSIEMGFLLACSSGPLCNEPLMGVIFIVQQIRANQEEKQKQQKTKIQSTENPKQSKENEKSQISENQIKSPKAQLQKSLHDNFGPLAGQIISTVKDCCLQSFLGGSPRLVQPMYLCELHTDQQYYGSIYNELSKRRAQIISQDLHEFSNVFIIRAYLSMLQSHNFCFDILDKSQGTVNAQLDLNTWKIYNQDPFFTPLTIEQIQENGLDNTLHNAARILLDKIRQKKGMLGTQKIIVAAEKQRTLKKN